VIAHCFTKNYQQNIVDTIIMKISRRILNNLKEEFKESKYWTDYPIRRRNRKLKNASELWKNIKRYDNISKVLEERIISIEYEVICKGSAIDLYKPPEKFKAIKFKND
jgi:hypothetical protein